MSEKRRVREILETPMAKKACIATRCMKLREEMLPRILASPELCAAGGIVDRERFLRNLRVPLTSDYCQAIGDMALYFVSGLTALREAFADIGRRKAPPFADSFSFSLVVGIVRKAWLEVYAKRTFKEYDRVWPSFVNFVDKSRLDRLQEGGFICERRSKLRYAVYVAAHSTLVTYMNAAERLAHHSNSFFELVTSSSSPQETKIEEVSC